MKKSFFAIAFFMFFANLNSQTINSFHVNGGLIIPTTGHIGTSIGFGVTHQLNNDLSLYLSSGFSNWGRNKVLLNGIYSELSSYSQDAHKLYPFYIGSRMTIRTIKTFQIYVSLEIGYNYLEYDSYQNIVVTDETTKKILSFYPDVSSRIKVSENLFGFGFGLGFTQKISDSFSFLVEYKRNTMLKNFENLRDHFALNVGTTFSL